MKKFSLEARAPQLGDRRVVTAEELGWERAAEIVKGSTSARSEQVKALLAHAQSPQAIFVQQWVRSPHAEDGIAPRNLGITAMGKTERGDELMTTYVAWRAALGGKLVETLRLGANSAFRKDSEASAVFAWVHPWHWLEANCLRRAEFEDVCADKVAESAVMSVRDWTRGKDQLWLRLSSPAAKRAASRVQAKLAAMEELEERIRRREESGQEADPRVVRRYKEMRFGVGGDWIFFGVQCKFEVEREHSVEAIAAARRAVR